MNFVTVYTDASMCSKTGIGAWACWIKYGEGQTLDASGPFKSVVRDSTEAELKAIANAMKIVVRDVRPEKSIIVIVTDSEQAIHCVKGIRHHCTTRKSRARRKSLDAKHEIGEKIRALVPEGCSLRIKKVAAHYNDDGRRSYVNGIVDRMARNAMRAKRDAGASA
jgi:ribonuclease HI